MAHRSSDAIKPFRSRPAAAENLLDLFLDKVLESLSNQDLRFDFAQRTIRNRQMTKEVSGRPSSLAFGDI